MRLELHLFLWVTAGMAVLLQLSGGIRVPEQVSSERASMRAQLVDAKSDTAEIKLGTHSADGRLGSVVYDPSVHPMFTVIAMPEIPPQVVLVPETILPPVLKGVLGGAIGRRAVFSRDPGSTEVVTVSPGESVADYRIEQIGEDFVTAVSPAGEEVRFELRGVGEGH